MILDGCAEHCNTPSPAKRLRKAHFGHASHYGLDAEVVRLPSVDDLETLVTAGIPAAISVAFDNGELTGAGYGTAGHLMVVVGFTASGDFIVNGPFSPSDGSTGHGSGGAAYVYTPHDTALPAVADPANPTW
jgi:hypothetical protein